MKVCYFIQSHQNPEQICRLVQVIKKSSPNSQVLINHDFSSSHLDLTSTSKFSEIDIIKRKKAAGRGNSSILKIYLNAINWLFNHNSEFDWLICLSGQDYPTQPISEIEHYLSLTEYDGFIRYCDLFSEESVWNKKNRKRYFAQYIHLPESSNWLLKKFSSRIKRATPILVDYKRSLIGMETKNHFFNNNFRCYRGWYWNTLSKKCVKFLRDYLRETPELLRYYTRTIAPEESIIQSVLINSKRFNFCNDDKRYYDYPPELEGYARVLTVADYSKITNGEFHFARKFDSEQDSKILDMLDTKVLNNSFEGITSYRAKT
jgi:hypothetical protein